MFRCTELTAIKFLCGGLILSTIESVVCDPYFYLVCVKLQLWSIDLNYRSLWRGALLTDESTEMSKVIHRITG